MSKNNLTTYVIIAVVVLVLGGLFAYPRLKSGGQGYAGNLPCLAPNLPEVQHEHPNLKIIVDGKDETIPANIGLSGSCHRPLHTHDATGVIHIESQVVRDYKLGEFFEVWGQPLQKIGYELEMTIDGQLNSELENLIMKDKQEIVLKYTKET